MGTVSQNRVLKLEEMRMETGTRSGDGDCENRVRKLAEMWMGTGTGEKKIEGRKGGIVGKALQREKDMNTLVSFTAAVWARRELVA